MKWLFEEILIEIASKNFFNWQDMKDSQLDNEFNKSTVLYVLYCHTSILNGVLITYETVDSILSGKKSTIKLLYAHCDPSFFERKVCGKKKKEKYVDMF